MYGQIMVASSIDVRPPSRHSDFRYGRRRSPDTGPATALASVNIMMTSTLNPRHSVPTGHSGRRNHWCSVPTAVASALLLVLTGCGGGNTEDAEALSADVATSGTSPVVEVVNAMEFAAVVDEPDVTVIDVRTPEEFATSRLENAELFDIASPDFIEMISTLDASGRYAVYCRSGNRSAVATAAMRDLGFTDVVELGGGILEWESAGYPTVSG